MKTFLVYIVASRSRTLYVGVTSNLSRRLAQHRSGLSGFTMRYRVARLVYYEVTTDAMAAIAREKQIKSYRRSEKVGLIARVNPAWNDLADTADPSLRSG